MAMKVVEVNVGEKIPYTVSKTKVTFNDELMLNLAKLERDFDVSVDICIDKFGMLVTGLGVKYMHRLKFLQDSMSIRNRSIRTTTRRMRTVRKLLWFPSLLRSLWTM